MTEKPWLALGWQCGQLTGWGQFGAHFARTCTNAGYRVILPAAPDPAGVLPLDRPLLNSLAGPIPEKEPGWLLMALGNGQEPPPQMPDHVKVAGIIFVEDTGSINVEALNQYAVIVAGSRWTERVLREEGVERVVLAHQGYDSRVFFPTPSRQESPISRESIAQSGGMVSRPLVFSGGKLEFRKGQDIAIEAFKRFRQTPEGKDAVLVCAWDNQWPQTMDGIWLSGYVKGMPAVKHGRLDLAPWLIANGLPEGSFIDCGRLTPPELAHVLRSCTVGIFPNRAESGTNLVLVEALASGLPVIASSGHGHQDVLANYAFGVGPNRDVPQGCRLYKSTDGWIENDPWQVAGVLSATVSGVGMAQPQPAFDRERWSWDVLGPAMAEAILESQAVPA